MKSIALAVGVVCCLTAPAAALEVSQSTTVAGKPEAVWKKIGSFCAIQEWHPVIAKCEEMDEGGAHYQVLTTKDGAKIKEKLLSTTDGSYSYEIIESPLPVQNYRSTISVTGEGDQTKVDWKSSFEAKGASDKDAENVISGIYKAGLDKIATMGGN